MIEYKYKKTGLPHKDLVNFQFEVLGIKSGTRFYQQQCGKAKLLLEKYEFEDLMRILRMIKEVGIPKSYKSIYFLDKDTEKKIEISKNYFKNKEKPIEKVKITNQKVKRKFKD